MIINSLLTTTSSLRRGCVGVYPLTQNAINVYGPAQDMVLSGAQITANGANTASGQMFVPYPHPNYLKYTIAFWMRHDTVPDGTWSRGLIWRGPRSPGAWLYTTFNGFHFSTLMTLPDGSTAFRDCDAATDILTRNQWFHIAMCSEQLGPFTTRLFLYIDGVLRRAITHSAVAAAPGVGDGLMFRGNVEWRELRLYERVVSGSEVRQMMKIRAPI